VSRHFAAAVAVVLFCGSEPLLAQNPLTRNHYKALKNVKEVRFLLRVPDDSDRVRATKTALGLDASVLSDLVTVAFEKSGRKLLLSRGADKPYLVLGWVGDDDAMSLSLTLWRWVRVTATADDLFVPVWQKEMLVVGPDRQTIRDCIEQFATAFAADHIRANR
jgi:hypothetical protein